jgi:alpha-L-fucosidase
MRYFLSLVLAASAALVQTYRPAPENLKAREWFQDSQCGLSLHRGIYSLLGQGESVTNNDKLTVAEYESCRRALNPTQFNAAEWVRKAKDAGMSCITITSKQHDGFAMWGTKQSDWDRVDRTPYGKDVLKILADECHRQGIKLFFHQWQLDWHIPNYFPPGRSGLTAGRPLGDDWYACLDYLDGQLRELLTNELLTSYGQTGGIWVDGMWDKPDADWRLGKTYGPIDSLPPATLVGSNHRLKPLDGEDFQMFERDLPGSRMAEFNARSEIGTLPLKTGDTIDGAWGNNRSDQRFKTPARLIQYLEKAAGNNGNFLWNVGPMANGKFQSEFVEPLLRVGEWLPKNGDSIDGTRGGPIKPRLWGLTTRKAGKIYVHLLDWPDQLLARPKLANLTKASLMRNEKALEVRQLDDGTILRLPEGRDPIDTIIVLAADERR